MVAVGPIPGNTPISVPRSAPSRQKPRLVGVSASLNPSMSRSRNSTIRSSEGPDGHLDAKTDDEDEGSEGRQSGCEQEHLTPPGLAVCKASDQQQPSGRGHEAELLGNKGKA